MRPAWGMVRLWKLWLIGLVFFSFISANGFSGNAIRGGLSKMGWKLGTWKPGAGKGLDGADIVSFL